MALPPIRNMVNGTPFRGGVAVALDTEFAAGGSILYVGVAGDLSLVTDDGSILVFKNHPVGYVPGLIRRVNASGTTATNMLALY